MPPLNPLNSRKMDPLSLPPEEPNLPCGLSETHGAPKGLHRYLFTCPGGHFSARAGLLCGHLEGPSPWSPTLPPSTFISPGSWLHPDIGPELQLVNVISQGFPQIRDWGPICLCFKILQRGHPLHKPASFQLKPITSHRIICILY